MGKIVGGEYIPDYIKLDELGNYVNEELERKLYKHYKELGYDDKDGISAFSVAINAVAIQFNIQEDEAFHIVHLIEDIYGIG